MMGSDRSGDALKRLRSSDAEPELASVLNAVADAYTRQPSATTGAVHAAVMRAATRFPQRTGSPDPRSKTVRAWTLKGAAAVLGASLVSSGLAYAGVPHAPNPVKLVVAATTADDGAGNPEPTPSARAARAAEHKESVDAYTSAVRSWTRCVQENASARGSGSGREGSEGDEPVQAAPSASPESRFDPRAACGEHPDPHDFGLRNPPGQSGRGVGDGNQTSQLHRQDGNDVDDDRERGRNDGPPPTATGTPDVDEPDEGVDSGSNGRGSEQRPVSPQTGGPQGRRGDPVQDD